MGNLQIAKDLAKGIVDETEIQTRVETYSPKQLSSAASSVLLSGNLALADYAVTKNFATVTYTGNGSTQNITTGIPSVDFTVSGNGSGYWLDRSTNQVKTDAGDVVASGSCVINTSKVHIKSRSAVGNNVVFDGIRGVNKRIDTNQSIAEQNETVYLTAYTATGFTLGNGGNSNASGATYVAYQTLYTHIKWGTTNQGKFYVEAYNPVTREGMIYYIGSGLAGHEIPHSQGVELDFITTKNLDTVFNWTTATSQSIGYLRLNTTDALANSEVFNFSNTAININDFSCGFSNGNEVITYYKAKSETWTIVQYQGTGTSGNFVETKDVYGVARKPRMVIIKSTSTTGNWQMSDTERGQDKWLQLNLSNVEAPADIFDILSNGFSLTTTDGTWNGSGQTYIALVEFDTNAGTTPDDSYFNLPTDDSNLNLTNGIFSYTNGIGSNGYDRSTESYTGSIDFAGMADGMKWIAKTEGGSFVAYDKKPSIGMYEKTSADDNRLVFKDGKYYTTTGGELVTNGTFDSDVTGWTDETATSTLTWESGRLKVTRTGGNGQHPIQTITTVVGKEYAFKMTINPLNNGCGFRLIDSTGATIQQATNTAGTTEFIEFSMVAEDTSYRICAILDAVGNSCYFDDITVYKLEPTLDTEVPTPISFLKNPIMVQSETPQYIDYNDELAQNVVESIEASGDIVLDGTSIKNGLIGHNQTWQNVTASRTINTTYTNTTLKPILVYFGGSSGVVDIYGWVDGLIINKLNINSANGTVVLLVPPGSTYKFTISNGATAISSQAWFELR